MSPERLTESLESAVRERPLLAHVLDLRIVARAVTMAAVGALLVWLIVGAALAAIVLLVVYFGGWYALARLSYDRRRESRPADGRRDEARRGTGQPAGAL